ncbi:MAG: methyltransferase domain-containing protein [Pseudomonadota bacterium]
MSDGETTTDRLLAGEIVIVQPQSGFRAGTDSVLLGVATARLGRTQIALDAGCGAGGALFSAAYALPATRFCGLDSDAAILPLADQGVHLNGLRDRVEVVKGDMAALPAEWENQFDLVFSNPPYFPAGASSPPGAGKDAAYTERVPLDAWLKAMLFATRPRGTVLLIHRAAELARILARLDRQAGEIVVMPVRPAPGLPASRVIVRARKGLRPGPVTLLDGLVLHEAPGGGLTERAKDALEGKGLDWR